MKPIQIMFDEQLLGLLDEDPEVQRTGRSALFRRLASEYLARRRERSIDEQYRKAYAAGGGLGPEFEGWEEEAAWPED